ncbi:MAG: lipase maturation factor family protein [Polyangiaceae bacterium]
MPESAVDESIPFEPSLFERVFVHGVPFLWARWLFLRALAAVFFSAFLSLAYQIHGLIGPQGVLPANDYLQEVAAQMGPLRRVWFAPSFLWLGAGDGALTALVVIGFAASLLLAFNIWPRGAIAVAGLAFLSFIAAAQEFAMYQSDGMLLEAAFLSLFFAPRGWRPGLGGETPPSRATLFLLRWEWFRIYFESGIVKIASHDPQWASLTAMDHYYENGPLPTWIGWYAQHLPHGFHAFTVILTFVVELGVVWLAWLGRRARLVCFAILTPFQIGIILTANYAFLNYLVLVLGVLLLDDGQLARIGLKVTQAATQVASARWRSYGTAFVFTWIVYVTVMTFLHVPGDTPLALPVLLLEPARVANAYGLFAVMTESRYELEFQATRDGVTWVPYRYRFKPQDMNEPPGIYAPYQPRFEWNLWFASLGWGRGNEWVVEAELRLMQRSPAVLALFREDPLHGAPPLEVRIVEWQYWFTSLEEHRKTGAWWTRKDLGLYAPMLERKSDGTIGIVRE